MKSNITIITSEPRGAYHLMPLYEEMSKRNSVFTHLVPYPENLQGQAWRNVSSSLSSIDRCDTLVLAGGGFTAWSESILTYATRIGKRIYLSELAYGSFTNYRSDIKFDKVSALNRISKIRFSEKQSFNSDDVIVTGSPQAVEGKGIVGGYVLLLSTSDMSQRDPDHHLIEVANYLKKNDIPYKVRLHPREEFSSWEGFKVSNELLLSDDLNGAKLVVAYPGTPTLNAVASNIPLLNLIPNDSFSGILDPSYNSILLNWASTGQEAIDKINNVALPDIREVTNLLGSNENVAKKIVDFWESN